MCRVRHPLLGLMGLMGLLKVMLGRVVMGPFGGW